MISIGAPHTKRTPWYTQSDFSITQNFKITESKMLSFSVESTNLFNHRAVTAFNEDITSLAVTNQYIPLNDINNLQGACGFGVQCYILDGTPFYAAVTHPYDVQGQLNNFKDRGVSGALNSAYHTPIYYQLARNIRLGVKFSF